MIKETDDLYGISSLENRFLKHSYHDQLDCVFLNTPTMTTNVLLFCKYIE